MGKTKFLVVAASLVSLGSSLLPAAYADGMPDLSYTQKPMKRHHKAQKTAKIIYRDRIITKNQIIERPVEKVVTVEKIVEKPVIIERTMEQSAVAEPVCIDQPLTIQRREKKPFFLLRLHLFPRKGG